MNARHLFFSLTPLALLGALCFSSAEGQEPKPELNANEARSLFDSVDPPENTTSPSDVRRSRMSTAELRQARALHRANQRVARLEYNLWIGHEPLRPRWNSLPMMSSKYQPRKVYVPVYIYSR